MMTIVIFLLVISILLFVLVSNFISSYFGAPYSKSDEGIISQALKKAKLKTGEVLYDLGSGNGEVLLVAEKLGVKALGYEISPFYFLWAKCRTYRHKNIEVRFQNIERLNLSKVDVIYCYLMPSILKKLATKFQKELKKTARLISIDFQIKNMYLTDKLKVQNHTIYIYRSQRTSK